MSKSVTPRTATARAFTILEVLLAVTIFAIVSLAVFVVFRTGSNVYKNSNRDTVVFQRARFIMDAVGDDLDQCYYRDETSYNLTARQKLEEFEQARIEAERTKNWDDFEKTYGPAEPGDEDNPNHVGNPFERYKVVDVNFIGEDGGEKDMLSFAVQRPMGESGSYMLWGLGRVTYKNDSGVLVRTTEEVQDPPRTMEGEVLPREKPPTHTIIAEGVEGFDITYAFWYDNQWYEVDDWNSANRQIRNGNNLMGTYETDEESMGTGVPLPGSDEWDQYLNEEYNQPLDRLPTYVRMVLSLSDPQNPSRLTKLERIFRVPGSQETWVINAELDEEQQENERQMRDGLYTQVYPGAMDKRN